MRTNLLALLASVSVAACTDSVPDAPAESFDGNWHKGTVCDAARPGGETGFAPIPEWVPFSVAAIDNAVIRWVSFDGADVLATHDAMVDGDCLTVPAGIDDGRRHEAYELCLDDAVTMTGAIEWNHGTVNERVCEMTLRRLD